VAGVALPLDLAALGIYPPRPLTVVAVHQVLQEIEKKSGVAGVPLHMGSPGLPAPEVIKEAQIEAIRQGLDATYCLEGDAGLMAELARYFRQRIGVEVDEDNVIVVNGGMEAVAFAVDVLGHRDERRRVAFVTPGFTQTYERLKECGLVPVEVPKEQGGREFIQRLRDTVRKVQASLIVLSDPNNPTGGVLSDEELQGLAEICNDPALEVICAVDDAYLELNYTPRTIRHLLLLTEQALSLWSASKVYSQAGNRIGAILGRPNLLRRKYPRLEERFGVTSVAGALKKLRHNANVSPNYPAQVGVAAGLRYDNEQGYVLCQQVREVYRRRLEELQKICLRYGFELLYAPGGALYLAVDHPRAEDGDDLALRLLRVGVSSVPLHIFLGPKRGVRLSVSVLDEAAGKRLEEALAAFARL